jgi:predicted O-methyltransferase YrrM
MKNKGRNTYFSIHTGVPGWETPEEENLLAYYAMKVPEDGVIVETGAEFGQSASLFAKFSPQSAQILSIDIDQSSGAEANLKEAGLDGRVLFVEEDALKAGRYWKSKSKKWKVSQEIDLLFIDDLHTKDHVLGELKAWSKYLKPSGHIILHDVAQSMNPLPHRLHHEVAEALFEFLAVDPSWEVTQRVHSTAVLSKVEEEPHEEIVHDADPTPSDEGSNELDSSDSVGDHDPSE